MGWRDGYYLRVENNAGNANSDRRDIIRPEFQEEIDGRNLKRDHNSFIEEEVPADHEAQSIIEPMASKSNETPFDWHVGCHFGGAIANTGKDPTIDSESDEQAGRPTGSYSIADGDEKSGTNGSPDGEQLNLAIIQSTLETLRAGKRDGPTFDVVIEVMFFFARDFVRHSRGVPDGTRRKGASEVGMLRSVFQCTQWIMV